MNHKTLISVWNKFLSEENMWHFSVERKDTEWITRKDLMRHGIFCDVEFRNTLLEEIKIKLANTACSQEKMNLEHDLLDFEGQIFFTVMEGSPQSLEEADNIIKKVSFFSAQNIWVNGQQIIPDCDY